MGPGLRPSGPVVAPEQLRPSPASLAGLVFGEAAWTQLTVETRDGMARAEGGLVYNY